MLSSRLARAHGDDNNINFVVGERKLVMLVQGGKKKRNGYILDVLSHRRAVCVSLHAAVNTDE